jgi:hypothetical protein
MVDNVICVTSIDDGAHIGIDDLFEGRACRAHPVTGRGEPVVYAGVVGLEPWSHRANLGGYCWVVKICVKLGRIWVRFRRGHVIRIPVSCKSVEDLRVAEGLGRRTDRGGPPRAITCNDLHPF